MTEPRNNRAVEEKGLNKALAVFFFFSVFFSTALRAQETAVERTLSLEQSVQTALQNNQGLLAAQGEIRIAHQRVQEARSHFFPKAALNLNASRYLAEQSYLMPPEFGFTLLRPSMNLGPDTFYSARAWLVQSLYTGGRTRNNLRLASAGLEQARIRHEEIRGQVVFSVTKAFYDLLLIQRQLDLCEKAAKQVEELADNVRAKDLPRQSAMEALRQKLGRARAVKSLEKEKAYLAFLDTLGLEYFTSVDLAGDLAPRQAKLDLAKLLAQAQESRLEIRGTEFQKEIDQLAVNLSEAERFPVVAFGTGYEMSDRRFPLETAQWNATLNISLPLFDGFSSRARIRQRRIQANQSRILRTEIEDRISREVRESFADQAFWQSEIARRAEDVRRLAALNAPLQKSQDPVEAAQAVESLLETRLAYWEAVHGQRVSLARLQKSVGRDVGE